MASGRRHGGQPAGSGQEVGYPGSGEGSRKFCRITSLFYGMSSGTVSRPCFSVPAGYRAAAPASDPLFPRRNSVLTHPSRLTLIAFVLLAAAALSHAGDAATKYHGTWVRRGEDQKVVLRIEPDGLCC